MQIISYAKYKWDNWDETDRVGICIVIAMLWVVVLGILAGIHHYWPGIVIIIISGLWLIVGGIGITMIIITLCKSIFNPIYDDYSSFITTQSKSKNKYISNEMIPLEDLFDEEILLENEL